MPRFWRCLCRHRHPGIGCRGDGGTEPVLGATVAGHRLPNCWRDNDKCRGMAGSRFRLSWVWTDRSIGRSPVWR